MWRRLQRLPLPLRRTLHRMLKSLPVSAWDQLIDLSRPAWPRGRQDALNGEKVYKLAEVIALDDLRSVYYYLVSQWKKPAEDAVIGAAEPVTVWQRTTELPPALAQASFSDGSGRLEELVMFLDLITYLPDDILVKVDRAAMGVSLETRVPLLDHRVVEFVWRLPVTMKLRAGRTKQVLREVLYRYVPQELVERPKMGFGVPIEQWLRGPLRAWAEDLLAEARLRREGFFHPAPIRRKWAEHLAGKCNCAYDLWSVLMFQAWLEDKSQHSGL